MNRRLLAAIVLVPFATFSSWVAWRHGFFGFLSLARAEPWALQMLLDLVISCSLVIGWMRADARRNGVNVLPYAIATIALGSIGPLAYLVLTPRRET